jgi:hypothetical protein
MFKWLTKRPGCNVIKLLRVVRKIACPGKPFQPSLIFVIKAEAFSLLHYRVSLWHHPQTLDLDEKVCEVDTL